MSQAAKAQEPSMEEILASIRRIIADDDTKPAADEKPTDTASVVTMPAPPPKPVAAMPAAPAPPPRPAEPEAMNQDDIDAMLAGFGTATDTSPQAAERPDDDAADVLELTPAMESPAERPATAGFQRIDANSDVVFADSGYPESQPGSQPASQFASQTSSLAARSHPAVDFRSTNEDSILPLLSDHATNAVTSAFGSLAHTVLAQNARTLDDLVRDMLRPMLKDWLDDNLPNIVERLVRSEIERVSRGRG